MILKDKEHIFTIGRGLQYPTALEAALKIKGDDAKPAMLMQMGTGFGGDVTVAEGMATFEIGTKLEDGQKRKFSIMFHNM